MIPPRHALVLILAVAGCSRRDNPETAALQFFELVRVGNTAAAYANAAFAFQAQQTADLFAATVKEMELPGYTAANVSAPELTKRSAKFRVDITTQGGRSVPLVVTLNDEGGRWRVFSLKSPRNSESGVTKNRFSLIGKGAAFTNPVNQSVPTEPEIRQLSRDSMKRFSEAVKTGLFDDFYANVSAAWQKQLTLGQLSRVFQPFVTAGESLAETQDVELILDEAAHINTEGMLIVTGSFPTKPHRVQFLQKYLYELPNWKLFGFEVNVYK